MKKTTLFMAIALLITGCISEKNLFVTAPSPQESLIKKEATARISQFADTLKAIIISSLKSDPTGANGLDVCSKSAMSITDNFNKSIQNNITIRRTALKYRNVLNKPDSLDEQVMSKFLQTKGQNDLMIRTSDGYRVYKPLYITQPCLVCHGSLSAMNPATVAKIKEYYPKDLANGFRLGDFRGVIVAGITAK